MTTLAKPGTDAMTLTELERNIERAFDGVTYPGDDKLTECGCDECRYPVSKLRGKDWRRLNIDDLHPSQSPGATVGMLSPLAFRYFLPGIILLAVRFPDDLNMLPHDIIGRFLALGRSARMTEETVRQFDFEQRAVIADIIEYFAKRDGTHCPALIVSAIQNLRTGNVGPYPQKAVREWADSLTATSTHRPSQT